MQPDRLSDEQLDQLAAELAPRLPTGTHGDRVILPRRQFVAALGGTLGAGALMALGVDEATAQAAGSVGTAEEPVDLNAWDLDVANEVTSDVDMAGNDMTGVGSFSTETLSVDGIQSNIHWEAIAQFDETDYSDGVLSMQIGDFDAYKIELYNRDAEGEQSDFFLTLNGDDDLSSDSYGWEDNDGTRHVNEPYARLWEHTSSLTGRALAVVNLYPSFPELGSTIKVGLTGNSGRIGKFSSALFFDVNLEDSINLHTTDEDHIDADVVLYGGSKR